MHTVDEMEISALFIGLGLALGYSDINSGFTFNFGRSALKQNDSCVQDRFGATEDKTEDSAVMCKLHGITCKPAYSMDGDYVIGGVFSIHYNMLTVRSNYTTMPEPERCTGRLVKRKSGV